MHIWMGRTGIWECPGLLRHEFPNGAGSDRARAEALVLCSHRVRYNVGILPSNCIARRVLSLRRADT